ncbi:hypothetical protein ACOMHN_051695 [Nucella lapillus]
MSQSWPEFLSGLLQASTRVDKAAVFSSVGQPLAASEGLEVSDKDGRAILYCLRDPARTLTRITIDDTDYRCFQGNGQALVGMATNGSGRVLVARVTGEEGAVVIVMGTATSKGSFLFEVQQSLLERTQRRQPAPQGQRALHGDAGTQQQMPQQMQQQMQKQQQKQQQKQKLQQQMQQQMQQQKQQQPKKLLPPPSSPVNKDQVLVQLHD